MAHIKEPDEIDFIIESPPLTGKERKEISELIKKIKGKTKNTRKKNRKKEKR